MNLDGRSILAAGMFLLITVAAYYPAKDAGFVFDDDMYVTANPFMGTPEGLGKIWTGFAKDNYPHQYYPLTSTAFWLQYWIWQDNPLGYHVVNVLLHAINAVLLWRVLKSLGMSGAWLGAAIFAVHPVHVQSVVWISELKNVLSTIFVLLSMLLFLQYFGFSTRDNTLQDPVQNKFKWHLYGLGLLLFFLALLSKTATALLPIALLIVLWWKNPRLYLRNLISLVPLVILAVGFISITVYLESTRREAQVELYSDSFLEECLVAGRAVWFYAGKLIWPDRLVMIYHRWQVDSNEWHQYFYPVSILAAIVILWAVRHRIGKGAVAAIVYFVVAVAPLSFAKVGFIQHSYVADHWQYWGSMGMIALATGAAMMLAKQWRLWNWALLILAAALLISFSSLTWKQACLYESDETIWRNTLKHNSESWAAHSRMGNLSYSQGNLAQATIHHRQAVKFGPTYAQLHNNLALVLAEQNEHEEAIGHFHQALRIMPDMVVAHNNIGRLLQRVGRLKEAIDHYKQVLRIDPDNVEAHSNLGFALQRAGNPDQSAKHFRAVLRINPDSVEAHNHLGIVLAIQGRLDEAISEFREALQLDPQSDLVRKNLERVKKRRTNK